MTDPQNDRRPWEDICRLYVIGLAFIMFILMLFFTIGQALAFDSGVCVYQGVVFKVEESTDLTYAVEFAKKHKGQLVTDKDSEIYSVIWNEDLPAPEVSYQCTKNMTED